MKKYSSTSITIDLLFLLLGAAVLWLLWAMVAPLGQ
jgi:hypothetical protein